MKFFLLAAFAVICSASTLYRGKSISVNEDGSILITSPYGKRVVISKPNAVTGQKTTEIFVSGPNIPSKRIQVAGDDTQSTIITQYPWSSVDSTGEDLRLKRSSKSFSQSDILFEILKDYQGVVDAPQYDKLLARIDKAVKKGEISKQIYDVLLRVDQIDQPPILGQQQQQYISPSYQQPTILGQQQQQYVSPSYQTDSLGQQYGYGRTLPMLRGGVDSAIPRVQQDLGVVTQQTPIVTDRIGGLYGLGGQYLPQSQYIYPLLQRSLPINQQQGVDDMLMRQQLVGEVPTLLQSNLIYDTVPQRGVVLGSPLKGYLMGGRQQQQLPLVQGGGNDGLMDQVVYYPYYYNQPLLEGLRGQYQIGQPMVLQDDRVLLNRIPQQVVY